MLLAEFPFLCTLSPSLPMAASQGASTAGLALPYQRCLCVITKKNSVLLGFIISGNFPADTLNSQAGGKSFEGHAVVSSALTALGASYSAFPWE